MAAPTDGGRLAGSVAKVIADVLHEHMQASEQTRSEQGQRHVTSILEMWESDFVEVAGPLLAKFAPAADEHPEAAEVFSWLTSPDHQVQLLAIVFAIQPLVSGYINALLAPSQSATAQLAWRHDTNVPLSPQQAAGAVIRGWISEGQGEAEAAQSGVSSDRFQIITNTGRLPPGPMQVLEGWNRGFLGQGDVNKAIIESDIGSQWAPFFEKLRYAAMSPALAVEAAVQTHLDMATAQKKYAEGGADPADFEVAYQTAGSPPGVQEMLQLLNRGIVTEQDVTTAIAESRVKTKYTPAILASRFRIPPLRSVTSFVTKGAMTQAEGIAALVKDGYDPALSAKIVAAASTSKVATAHNLAASTVAEMYEAGMIDRATAEADLHDLGYEAGEAGLLLALADHKAQARTQAHELSVIRSGYLKGNIPVDQAKALMTNVGIAPAAQTQALADWDFEVKARVRVLTEAQVVAAAKKGVITVDDAGARLTAMGYSDTDVGVLLGTAGLLDTTTAGA